MKERPILFSATMVRAILNGSKTQTRRVVKPQPAYGCVYAMNGNGDKALCMHNGGPLNPWFVPPRADSADTFVRCPYGKPGDLLWVRETHAIVNGGAFYRADGEWPASYGPEPVWRPSIHMPRWASRITLRVTSVRVERLQDISEADAKAEGVPPATPYHRGVERCDHVGGFHALWESINGAGSWDANPWVWVVGFERVQPQRAEVGHG